VTVLLESVDASLPSDLAAFGDIIREHHPTTEHWYLPITGVDPSAQGRGLGSTLLRHALAACDRDGLPAYLEASTLRSRVLYEHVGFTQRGEIQAGSSPTVWAMLRDPVPRAD
jgi:GNAT superfamily N-acetyltransferase